MNFLKFQIAQIFFYKDVVKSSLLSIFTVFIALGVMQKNHEMNNLLPYLLVIIPILASINHIDRIFYDDYKSGNLEFLLISYSAGTIVTVKATSIFLAIIFTIICSTGFSSLFFNISLDISLNVLVSSIFVTIIVTVIMIMIGSIRIYFERNSGILSAIIFPFLIPILILHGLYIDSNNASFLGISLGICMIVTPIFWYLCKNLISELYNN